MAGSGAGRGSMAIAASALQLFEDARAAADRPAAAAKEFHGGVGASPRSTRRRRGRGGKKRAEEAAAAVEDMAARKASFSRAKQEIDGIREAHHGKAAVYEANVKALKRNTDKGNRDVAEKALAMHHRIPTKRKKKKAPEENWSVFADVDRLAAEKKKRRMEKYGD
eukprot:m.450152 g.450152  ORF g.450152 m.450152 type:complete len:166 (-) comp19932_c0_seq1:248-745(-)